jgi:quercetin dioxygenase-like cupin family protein
MIGHENDKKFRPVHGDDVEGVGKKILIGPRDGLEGYLREFSLAEGGHTPYHQHPWSHMVYVLQGEGNLTCGEKSFPLRPGSVAYLEADKAHGFSNSGSGELRFLCLVPPTGDAYKEGD